MQTSNEKPNKIYILICILCAVCIFVSGVILLLFENRNNSEIMKSGHVETKEQITITVNINTATKSELMLLENIGSKKADNIIEHRKKHPFKKPEDLMKVHGIGEKIFLSIKDYICVD